MNLIPYVVEQTNRGERSYDIYSRLLQVNKSLDKVSFVTILQSGTKSFFKAYI